jgi:hypothetical protein
MRFGTLLCCSLVIAVLALLCCCCSQKAAGSRKLPFATAEVVTSSGQRVPIVKANVHVGQVGSKGSSFALKSAELAGCTATRKCITKNKQ